MIAEYLQSSRTCQAFVNGVQKIRLWAQVESSVANSGAPLGAVVEHKLPAVLPVEIALYQQPKLRTVQGALEAPVSGHMAEDQHSASFPSKGEVGQEPCHARGCLSPALTAWVGLIQVRQTVGVDFCDRCALPGVAPWAQFSTAMRAGKPACGELGLDKVGALSYDEHNGASGHPRGPLRAPAKRSEGVLAFSSPPHVAAAATGNATTPPALKHRQHQCRFRAAAAPAGESANNGHQRVVKMSREQHCSATAMVRTVSEPIGGMAVGSASVPRPKTNFLLSAGEQGRREPLRSLPGVLP